MLRRQHHRQSNHNSPSLYKPTPLVAKRGSQNKNSLPPRPRSGASSTKLLPTIPRRNADRPNSGKNGKPNKGNQNLHRRLIPPNFKVLSPIHLKAELLS